MEETEKKPRKGFLTISTLKGCTRKIGFLSCSEYPREKIGTTTGWATHWVIQAVDSGYPYTQPVPSLNITTFSDKKKSYRHHLIETESNHTCTFLNTSSHLAKQYVCNLSLDGIAAARTDVDHLKQT